MRERERERVGEGVVARQKAWISNQRYQTVANYRIKYDHKMIDHQHSIAAEIISVFLKDGGKLPRCRLMLKTVK